MPSVPPRVCICGRVVPHGARCQCQRVRDQKRRAAHDAARPSSAARGYDAQWRRIRAAFLEANPTCCVPGCGEPATDADHVLSISKRPDLRLDPRNLRPFCHSHHSAHTARTQGFAQPKDRP